MLDVDKLSHTDYNIKESLNKIKQTLVSDFEFNKQTADAIYQVEITQREGAARRPVKRKGTMKRKPGETTTGATLPDINL